MENKILKAYPLKDYLIIIIVMSGALGFPWFLINQPLELPEYEEDFSAFCFNEEYAKSNSNFRDALCNNKN